MKTFLLIPLLFAALCARAQTPVVIAQNGHLTTAPGIGGDAQTGFAFAKGDVITITGKASRQLDRMLVLLHPDVEIGNHRATKRPQFKFTMPQDGIAIFRFISDRGHTNKITYTVTRMPASAAVQNYNTKVIWEKPSDGRPGNLIPRREADIVTK
jgi:hypothetical protein